MGETQEREPGMLSARHFGVHLVLARLFVVVALIVMASCSNQSREVGGDFKRHVISNEKPADMPGPFDFSVQRELKRIEAERGARWEWVSWMGHWRSIFIVIVIAGASGAALRNMGKPAKPTKSKPLVSVVCIGGLTACVGVGFFFYGMSVADRPFLPFAGAGVVCVGLLLLAVGLCRRVSE